MPPADRLTDRLGEARRRGEGLLMVYLTLGDPLTEGPPDLAPVLARSGADILELGLPTPSTRPRGTEIAASFQRARKTGCADIATHAWDRIGRLRRELPTTPLVLLCYPETVDDIGWAALLRRSAAAGLDGMVLTAPRGADLERVTVAGIHAIPLIPPTMPESEARHVEERASCLCYRPLAGRTGEILDLNSAASAAAVLAARATKPFLVGFGIRNVWEIATLALHATGVVVGSELLRVIELAPPSDRVARAGDAARSWKAALRGPARRAAEHGCAGRAQPRPGPRR